MTGFAPDHPGAIVRPSPNFGERRDGRQPTLIILHYTGMESGQGAEDWLCNPQSQVSSHYLVHEDGRIVQMVREADRAWHAGQSSWQGEEDVNSRSIGIEIVNGGHAYGLPDFPDAQIAAVVELCRDVIARRRIRAEAVLAHSDVAPGRKVDPGEKFPWAILAAHGVGLYPAVDEGAGGADVAELQELLARYGYGVPRTGCLDAQTRSVIEAFQRHFHPACITGSPSASVRQQLKSLLKIAEMT